MPDYAERLARGETIPEQQPKKPPTPAPTAPRFGGLFGDTTPGENLRPPLAPLEPPVEIKGAERWAKLLRERPTQVGTPEEADAWILGVKPDQADPEFTRLLTEEQDRAKKRQEARERKAAGSRTGGGSFGPYPPDSGELLDEIGREKAAARTRVRKAAPRTVQSIIGPTGQEKDPTTLETPEEGADGQAGTMAPPTATGVDVGTAIASGDYVYIGTGGREYGGMYRSDEVQEAYMSTEDAYNLPAHWAPQDVAAMQKAWGLPVTGVFDKDTYALWKDAVDTSARLTAAGKKMSPMDVVTMTAKAQRRGGGGGGGGGYNASEVKAFFNSVAEQELGREATPEEQAAFFAAFNAAGEVDPQQFAIDWIRQQKPGEAGAYSAVNYYDAMLAVLGAQTSAAGG